jgi:hypothetical protein
MAMVNPRRYWFPAKEFGVGWGLPRAWEGWVVLAAYVVGLAMVQAFLPLQRDPRGFAIGVGASTAALILVCWLKGEPIDWEGRR